MGKRKKRLRSQDIDRLKTSFAAVENEKNKIGRELRKFDAKIKKLRTDLKELAHFGNEGG
jgi:septal ring factor EnvC (AmiA/AmiB activator)